MKKKNIKKIAFIILILVILLSVNVVYAGTTAELKFCDYSGIRKTLKIIGIILRFVKVIVPLILIMTGISPFFKAITSGKDEDLKAAGTTLAKKIIAGLIVLLLPGFLDYIFDSFVGYSDSGFSQCSNCVLDIDSCNVDIEDPNTMTD